MPKRKHKETRYNEFNPCGDDIFNVEKILAKRIKCRRVEYLLKWEGFGNEHNTWEPEKNISPFLISVYEQNIGKKKKLNHDLIDEKTSEKEIEIKKNGFERGLEPEKILSAGNLDGELMFSIKWKNTDETEFIQAELIKTEYPDLVIQFYENHLAWRNGNQIKYYDPNDDKSNKIEYSHDISLKMKPEIIFGIKLDDGELKFLVKWMNIKKPDLVLAKIAKKECPDLVIQFYEKKIQWKS